MVEDLRAHLVAVRALWLPVPGTETPLASALHDAGLLLAGLMAPTGAVVFLGLRDDGSLPAAAGAALGAHKVVANLM